MKKTTSKLTVLGALLVPLLVVSCGGQAPEVVDDSPEATAFRYRQGLMRAIAWKVGEVRAMAQGEKPANDAVFAKYARDIVTLASMVPEGFIPNSLVAGSAALPEVWTNMADFNQKSMDTQNAAQALADAATQNGFEAAKGLVQPLGQSCGGCHRPYRRRVE
jgi:cytochrome c556